jgi:hypothetical protein
MKGGLPQAHRLSKTQCKGWQESLLAKVGAGVRWGLGGRKFEGDTPHTRHMVMLCSKVEQSGHKCSNDCPDVQTWTRITNFLN